MLVRRTAATFTECGGTRLAAAVAYYALLSIFPLAAVLVAIAGLAIDEETVRERVIDVVVQLLPLTEAGDRELRRALVGAIESGGGLGIVSAAALLWTASGMAGAVRAGLNAVSGAEAPRPFLQGKAVDVLAVLTGGLALVASAALTVAIRVAGGAALAPLGLPGAEALLGVLAPIALSALLIAAMLRWLPARRISWGGVWRGALAAAVALWLLATAFGLYVEGFGRYNILYGSLGAAAALLAFAYLAAIVVLVAAAAAVCWTRAAEAGPRGDRGRPLGRRLRAALLGLVVRRR